MMGILGNLKSGLKDTVYIYSVAVKMILIFATTSKFTSAVSCLTLGNTDFI